MSLTGYEDQAPVRVGSSIGDITAGLFTTIGIQSALIKRNITNKGCILIFQCWTVRYNTRECRF